MTNVTRFHFPCSNNATLKIFYNSIGAEILRIFRTTTGLNKLELSYETLTSRMINQGANLKSFECCLCRIF